jgi:hypothetical protein
MRNLLSVQNGIFTGQEILDWIQHQIENNTSHAHEAKFLQTNIAPDRNYRILSKAITNPRKRKFPGGRNPGFILRRVV